MGWRTQTRIPEPGSNRSWNDVDDAPCRLSELGLVAACLHLDLIDEIKWRGIAERAEDNRIGAECPVTLVRDVDAIDYILIIETAPASDRRVAGAGRARTAHARGQVDGARHRATDRYLLKHVARDGGPRRRRRRIDDRGFTSDLHGLGERAHLEADGEADGLAEHDGHTLLFNGLEALKFDTNVVGSWREKRDDKAPIGIGRRRL
jgi:hypothetical protein